MAKTDLSLPPTQLPRQKQLVLEDLLVAAVARLRHGYGASAKL
jgi:hypothetical protein